MKKFELIGLTADVGIVAYGRDIKELFCNAAEGMFSIITDKKIKSEKLKIKNVEGEAKDREELLIKWLNELLFLAATKYLTFSRFDINNIDDVFLSAQVYGRPIKSPEEIQTEIKAATYHQLKITPPDARKSLWQARVVFDI